MGADAAVERHDGTLPGEEEIAARMQAEGLSPHEWGNGPVLAGQAFLMAVQGYLGVGSRTATP